MTGYHLGNEIYSIRDLTLQYGSPYALPYILQVLSEIKEDDIA